MAALHVLRSVVSLLLVVVWFVACAPWLYLVIVPGASLRPSRRVALVTQFMKGITRGLFVCLRLGGARFRRTGTIPTERPALIVMNHQSLVDIITVTLMSAPVVPAFVTRSRYAGLVPLVSTCVALLGAPVIDPRRAVRGSVEAIRQVAAGTDRPILIFPEGHRSLDGEIRPFKSAGAQAVLGARPGVPVYAVVTDGVWESRRFVDFVMNMHRIRGVTEVLGPFDPPASADEVPAFMDRLREAMVAHLRQMRERRGVL